MLKDLPGHDFGLGERLIRRGYWSTYRENQMRRRADAWVRQQLGASGGRGDARAELLLWQVLEDTYRCGVGDLFRYGLKPCFRVQSLVETASFDGYCDKLTSVLAHPIFGGRIDLARYALQLAVQTRYYEGHPDPLRPPYSRSAPAFIDTLRDWGFRRGDTPAAVLEDEAAMTPWLADVHQPAGFVHLVRRLLEDREPETVAASWNESVFFFLCASDIDALAQLLPAAPSAGSLPYSAGQDAAAAAAWLRDRKAAWLLAGLRETLIRTDMNHKRLGDVLPDIPAFDPDPLWHLIDETESKQLAALGWGDYPLEHASVLWCKGTTTIL